MTFAAVIIGLACLLLLPVMGEVAVGAVKEVYWHRRSVRRMRAEADAYAARNAGVHWALRK